MTSLPTVAHPPHQGGGLPPALRMSGLHKSFHGVHVLKGVDLVVHPGELHALVGENGSGKSTMIKMLAGFHPLDAGTIDIHGQRLEPVSARRIAELGVRFVHQDGGLIPELTAVENVLLAAPITRRGGLVDRGRERAHVQSLLDVLGVEVPLDKPVSDLRPVERSAISISKAFADGDVRLLVLDEPTAALPTHEVALLFGLLRRVIDAGGTIVYVTHRMDEVLEHADRTTVIRDGFNVATKSVAEVDEASLAALIVGQDVPSVQGSTAEFQSPVERGAREAPGNTSGRFILNTVRGTYLSGIDVEVRPGEILGVGGLSGSGREELAMAAIGVMGTVDRVTTPGGELLERPSRVALLERGIVLALGNRLAGSAFFELSVRENLSMTSLPALTSRGRVRRREEDAFALDWMNRLDIRPMEPEKPLRELSGGNQQKVILAKWLSTAPSVLVLDEPTAGVDVGARRSIYRLVREYAAEGGCVLFTSSDPQDLTEMADRVVLLSRGQVAAELRGAELSTQRINERLAQVERAATTDQEALR